MERVRQLLAPFRAHILRTAKAYTASAVVVVIGLLGDRGVAIPNDVREALLLLVATVVTWAITWLIPNRE